jgi:hypothetical protein
MTAIPSACINFAAKILSSPPEIKAIAFIIIFYLSRNKKSREENQ